MTDHRGTEGRRLRGEVDGSAAAVEDPEQQEPSGVVPPIPPVRPVADEPLLARLNRHGFRLVMVLDASVLLAVMAGSMVVRFGTDWPTYPFGLYLVSFVVFLLVYLGALYFGGLYEREPRLGAPPALPRATRLTVAAGGMVALLTLAATGLARELGMTTERALAFPFTNQVTLILLGAVGVATNRRLVQRLRTRREGPPAVLLVGPAEELERAERNIASDPRRARVVGSLAETDGLLETAERAGVTDVALLDGQWLESLYPHVIDDLERRGITVLLRVSGRETMFGLERVREIGGLPFVLLRARTMPRSRTRFKRFFDLVLLAIFSPILLLLTGLVALYQLLVVGRPLLYWQERVGERGRVFRMVKFRTMVQDAEGDGRGARLAATDDPRVVPACRWLRAMRLDELPQLWNVLRGEMSLVGPRPERPELTAGFERAIAGYGSRHELPPGMTGLAQIHGRYHTDPEYKLGYDLQYLVNWSPVLDLEILFRTIWVVLARRL
jgi:exopolysaccharide biosynthesis polyprenyl glycosylphosphotransferase